MIVGSTTLVFSAETYRAVETHTTAAVDAICVQTQASLIDIGIVITFVGMSKALQSETVNDTVDIMHAMC